MKILNAVIPAQAEIQTKNISLAQQGQTPRHVELNRWIPACAGMTEGWRSAL
jgi:hypothetical protein